MKLLTPAHSSSRRFLLSGLAALALPAFVQAAAIPLNTTTFTLNHSTVEDQDQGDAPTISGGILTITNGGGSDANTAFYNTQVSLALPFTASFIYQSTSPTAGGSGSQTFGADGVTFTIVSTSTGIGQIGGRGSGLGWGNNDSGGNRSNNFIANSAAVELTVYPTPVSFQTGLVTAGATGGTAGNYVATGLDFSDPTKVSLSYDGTTLTETLTDTVTNGSFTTASPLDLAGIVGSSAYIGFTAGSGGDSSTQTISSLDFSPAQTPEPASISLLAFGGLGLLARRRRA